MAGRLADAAVLRTWLDLAVPALTAARERIDAVNVFPVADGDTGTNVLLTVRGAADAVAGLEAGTPGADALRALGRGALLAARGNSGIIVSRYLGGLGEGADRGVAGALARAAEVAREAVHEPQDGTVLTVAEVVARAAADAGGDEVEALRAGVTAGRTGLAGISAAHPVLRSARVVDAGACALLVLLDALADALAGAAGPVDLGWLAALEDPVAASEGDPASKGDPASGADPAPVPPGEGPAVPGARAAALDRDAEAFEVMAVLRAGADPAGSDAVRAALAAVGSAVAVVDADGLRTVHVHADDPAAALRALADPVPGLAPGLPAGASATVRRLVGAPRRLVAATSRAELVAPLALAGVVVLVVPEAPGDSDDAVLRDAVDRAVEDARQPAHRTSAPEDATPVVVLPGAPLAARDVTAARPGRPPRTVLTAAADDLRVLVAATAPDLLGTAELAGVRTAVADDPGSALAAAEELLLAVAADQPVAAHEPIAADQPVAAHQPVAADQPVAAHQPVAAGRPAPADPAAPPVPRATLAVLLGAGATAADGLGLADVLGARRPDVAVVVAGPVPGAPAYRLALAAPAAAGVAAPAEPRQEVR